jgi:hypothetical protein
LDNLRFSQAIFLAAEMMGSAGLEPWQKCVIFSASPSSPKNLLQLALGPIAETLFPPNGSKRLRTDVSQQEQSLNPPQKEIPDRSRQLEPDPGRVPPLGKNVAHSNKVGLGNVIRCSAMKFGKRWAKAPGTEKLWLYKPTQKIADRPHKWTIILGLLSPALAALAAYVGLHAFLTSREALEVSQRAYVSFTIVKKDFIPLFIESPRDISRPVIVVKLNVNNMSNTPAYLDKGTYEFTKVHAKHIRIETG